MSNVLKEKFLLFRIRAKKDPEAFGKIYDFYVKKIYRFVYFKVASAELAEDLTSETFLKAWQYLMEKREVPYLQALLYSIARSVVIDHYRAAAHAQADIPLYDAVAVELVSPGSEQLLKDIEAGIDMGKVMDKLRGLKDEYREVVVMKFLDQMSTSEIASALGKSASNVRVLLHRATKALAEAVDDVPKTAGENPGRRKE